MTDSGEYRSCSRCGNVRAGASIVMCGECGAIYCQFCCRQGNQEDLNCPSPDCLGSDWKRGSRSTGPVVLGYITTPRPESPADSD